MFAMLTKGLWAKREDLRVHWAKSGGEQYQEQYQHGNGIVKKLGIISLIQLQPLSHVYLT
jgi:hypothetical protein